MRTLWLIAVVTMLAGCADDPSSGLPPAGSQPHPEIDQQPVQLEDMEGDLGLAGHVKQCDAGRCLVATATNEGSGEYYVSDMCVPPFSESMTRDGKAVHPREPMAYCAAFGTRAFAGGEMIDVAWEWDGRLWDDETGEMVDAPDGEYTWIVTFRAYESADGGSPIDLRLAFDITVAKE